MSCSSSGLWPCINDEHKTGHFQPVFSKYQTSLELFCSIVRKIIKVDVIYYSIYFIRCFFYHCILSTLVLLYWLTSHYGCENVSLWNYDNYFCKFSKTEISTLVNKLKKILQNVVSALWQRCYKDSGLLRKCITHSATCSTISRISDPLVS